MKEVVMSESQFEKLLKAARDKDEKNAEIKRLRELLRKCQPYVEAGMSACDTQLCDAIEREVGDE